MKICFHFSHNVLIFQQILHIFIIIQNFMGESMDGQALSLLNCNPISWPNSFIHYSYFEFLPIFTSAFVPKLGISEKKTFDKAH